MARKRIGIILAIALFLSMTTAPLAAEVTATSCAGYLTALKIPFSKSGTDRLSFKTGFPEGKTYEFLCVADAKNRFVYLAIIHLRMLDGNAPDLCKVTRKMAALNYGMVMTKLEWNEKAGEVRISRTVSTEDGLSQTSFHSAVTTLLLAAEQAENALK